MEAKRQASKSDAQQEAGRAAIIALGRRKGSDLQPRRLQLGDVAFQLDGYHEEDGRVVLAEVLRVKVRAWADDEARSIPDHLTHEPQPERPWS